jgi:uncharacterized protein YndB with AHSA1/START domain
MEFRTDGIWIFTMHGPDGTDYPNKVRYTYVSPDRIEYEHSGGDIKFTVRVEFVERQDGTEMDFLMTFPTAQMRREVIENGNAEEGLRSTVTRLDHYVAGQDPKNLELVIVRQFAVAQDRVWKALTEPDQLRQWLGPHGMNAELSSGELRVGGQWSLVMTGQPEMQFEAVGEYLAIEPEHLLKMTHRWKKEDGTCKPTTTITYKLHEYEGKTTMTFVQSGFWSEEACAAHLGGWDSCFEKLAILTGAAKADRSLELVREFDAPIDVVWKCWTEPDRVAKWFAPRPYTCPRCEIDLKPGGSFILVMRSPEGNEHPMLATIVDIEPQSRFGWVMSVPDDSGELAIQGGTTVVFEELGSRTRVTVHAYAAAYTVPGTYMVGGMEMGWNMTLDQMVGSATQSAA